MEVLLSNLQFLPLHDAEVKAICVELGLNGQSSLSIRIRLHEDESVGYLSQQGIHDRDLKLVFSDCWTVRTVVHSSASRREDISSLDVVQPSDMLRTLQQAGFGIDATLTHWVVALSGGSVVEALSGGLRLLMDE